MNALFTDDDLSRFFDRFKSKADETILDILMHAGEEFVTDARMSGNYTDQTGNLRSSIGYVIVKDGNVIRDNFALSEKGSVKMTGHYKARQLVNEIAKTHNNGYVLIGVAGMEYALFVEAIHSKDVISGAHYRSNIKLQEELDRIITALNNGR
ncbi:MAG: HK97 gp10 family phage protein [Marinifilaceae bacterium]